MNRHRYSDESVRVPSTGKPVFVMTGIERPSGGVRLYASRDLPSLHWGQRDQPDYTTAWHVDADMANVLIIDAATWGEAFARAFEIWENRDREQAELVQYDPASLTARGRRELPLTGDDPRFRAQAQELKTGKTVIRGEVEG